MRVCFWVQVCRIEISPWLQSGVVCLHAWVPCVCSLTWTSLTTYIKINYPLCHSTCQSLKLRIETSTSEQRCNAIHWVSVQLLLTVLHENFQVNCHISLNSGWFIFLSCTFTLGVPLLEVWTPLLCLLLFSLSTILNGLSMTQIKDDLTLNGLRGVYFDQTGNSVLV